MGGVGLLTSGGIAGAWVATPDSPRAWRVSAVDCNEPIVDGYDGQELYATLLTSRDEAASRLVERECFDPHLHSYLSLDYDEFVVSVRTAVLPPGQQLRMVSSEFDGDVLTQVVERPETQSSGEQTGRLHHVLTTWELNDAPTPERIEIRFQSD